MFTIHLGGRMPASARITLTGVAVGALLASGLGTAGTATADPNTTGTWGMYPAQTFRSADDTTSSTSYKVAVRAPINADGSSNFPAKRGVIPVQFDLYSGTGSTTVTTKTYDPPVWQSVWSDNDSDPGTLADNANDYSYATFVPTAGSLTFDDITNLSADYVFTDGDCAGGSLRWTITLRNPDDTTRQVHVYYGYPNGDGPDGQGCSGAQSSSGANLITTGATANRFEMPDTGAPVYKPYTDVQLVVGSLDVVRVSLIVDSGWGSAGDQVLNVSNVTVNDNTFVPKTVETSTTTVPTGAYTKTCELPQALLQWSKNDPSPTGAINEATTVVPGDSGDYFRQVDCKYLYNLQVSSLDGPGTYRVYANIDGNLADPATFDLR